MSYDRDIRRGRLVAWLLLFANIGGGIANLYAHKWTVAIACAIWAYNCTLVLKTAAIHQATRDMGRVIEAGLNAMRREMEEH